MTAASRGLSLPTGAAPPVGTCGTPTAWRADDGLCAQLTRARQSAYQCPQPGRVHDGHTRELEGELLTGRDLDDRDPQVPRRELLEVARRVAYPSAFNLLTCHFHGMLLCPQAASASIVPPPHGPRRKGK